MEQEQAQQQQQQFQQLDEDYRSTIHVFLKENKVYDCLPKNSQVVVVDRTFSVYDVIDLMVVNNYEESMIWNSDLSKFDGILTYTDISQIILSFYKETLTEGQNFLKRKGSFQQELAMMEEEINHIQNPNLVNQTKINNNEINQNTPLIGQQQNIQNQQQQFQQQQLQMQMQNIQQQQNNQSIEQQQNQSQQQQQQGGQKIKKEQIREIPNLQNLQFSQNQQNSMINQLKNFNVRQWLRYLSNHESDQKCLITVNLEEPLKEACVKMIQKNVHRIIVIDKESELVVGILNYKDILLLIIRNLTKDIEQENSVKDYDLKIAYLFGSFSKLFTRLFTVGLDDLIYDAFNKMIYDIKVSSIPVCDSNNKFICLIYRRDINFIWRTQNFQILGKTIREFLQFRDQQKCMYKLTSLDSPTTFTLNETVKHVVEKTALAPSNRLVCIDEESGQVRQILTLSDIFKYYLGETRNNNKKTTYVQQQENEYANQQQQQINNSNNSNSYNNNEQMESEQ